jgi:hypothetical protein
MALRPSEVQSDRDLAWLPLVTVITSYGKIDCLLERGRLDWRRLRHAAVTVPVAGAGVLTAAQADVWALRRQFKQ